MFKGLGQSGGKGAMAAGAFAAAVLALGVWIGSTRNLSEDKQDGAIAVIPSRDATPENATLDQNAVQGVSVGPTGEAATEPKVPETQDAPSEAAAAESYPPSFDEVRREPDGMTVIAGRGAPGSTVAVLKDGEEIASATADGSGKFATLAMIPPDGVGHVLTLLERDGDKQLASVEEILLAPIAAPIVTAEAKIEQDAPAGTEDREDGTGAAVEADEAGVADANTVPKTAAPSASVPSTDPGDGTGTLQTDIAAAETNGSSDPAQTDTAATSEPAATPLAVAGEDTAGAQSNAASDSAAKTAQAGNSTGVSQTPEAARGETDSATPLSGTVTAGDNAEAGKSVAMADNSEGLAVTTSSPSATAKAADARPADDPSTESAALTQATPLSGTATAKVEGSDAEGTSSLAATPLAETGTSVAENGTAAAPDTAAGSAGGAESSRASDDPTQTLLAQSGSASTTVEDSSVDPANAPAPNVADATPDRPEAVTTVPESPTPVAEQLAAAGESSEANDTAGTAPAQPPAPAVPTAPVAVLKSTAEGVERIDTAPPQVMTNVALDTIGYSDQGDVQLAGRAQPETREVRVYLNNSAVISLPVDQEGRWRGDLPDVDEGIYTLRVDELSAGGDVTSRVETPFKRESPETLAAASSGLTGPLSAITVQKGDTLWAISRERYGDPLLYVKVFQANSDNIRDPDLIYPGQVFDLPEETQSE